VFLGHFKGFFVFTKPKNFFWQNFNEKVFIDQLQSYSSQAELFNSKTTWMLLLEDDAFLFWFDLKHSHFLYPNIFFFAATLKPLVSEPEMHMF
jgi:hypothetical protein